MGTRFLLDTNTVIYLIKGDLPLANPALFVEAAIEKPRLSIISKIELLSWNAPTGAIADKYQSFVDDAQIFPLTDQIVAKTIELRKLPKKPKLPDAIIAATAIVHGLTLLSRNEPDFSAIPGLAFINPF